MITAFPLAWPETFPRYAKTREPGKFRTTLPAALKNVKDSLQLFANDSGKQISEMTLSSNVTLGQMKPADPGVAAWFIWDGMQVCIPVDRYSSVEANLQAIHHVIEARRTELRHGTLALVRATMTGFKALPPPDARDHWSVILGIARTASAADIKAAHARSARLNHPDAGGSTEQMARVNAARDQALKERA